VITSQGNNWVGVFDFLQLKTDRKKQKHQPGATKERNTEKTVELNRYAVNFPTPHIY
jgi:hypothetical protein